MEKEDGEILTEFRYILHNSELQIVQSMDHGMNQSFKLVFH